jgi:hypothetical protein
MHVLRERILAEGRNLGHSILRLAGIGAVINKSFEGGRESLREHGVPIEALVTIRSMANGQIEFAD